MATNKTSDKLLDTELFFQYSSQGLKDPICTEGFKFLRKRLEGDMRTLLKPILGSAKTDLYLVECFGEAGYAISIIHYGQGRGDFALLRVGLPVYYRCNGKNLVSFLGESLEAVINASRQSSKKAQEELDRRVEQQLETEILDKTRRLFSTVEMQQSEAPFAWCLLEQKTIEEVIDHYLPQKSFSSYQGVFFLPKGSVSIPPEADTPLIKESDLKEVTTFTIPKTLQPSKELGESYGITGDEFVLKSLTIGNSQIDISNYNEIECPKGTKGSACWESKKGFGPIERGNRTLAELQQEITDKDILREFTKDEFKINDEKSRYDRSSQFTFDKVTPSKGKFTGCTLPVSLSLAEFKEYGEKLTFHCRSSETSYTPHELTFEVDRDVFLRQKAVPSQSVTPLMRLEFKVAVYVPENSQEKSVQDDVQRALKSSYNFVSVGKYHDEQFATEKPCENDEPTSTPQEKRKKKSTKADKKRKITAVAVVVALVAIFGAGVWYSRSNPKIVEPLMEWFTHSDSTKTEGNGKHGDPDQDKPDSQKEAESTDSEPNLPSDEDKNSEGGDQDSKTDAPKDAQTDGQEASEQESTSKADAQDKEGKEGKGGDKSQNAKDKNDNKSKERERYKKNNSEGNHADNHANRGKTEKSDSTKVGAKSETQLLPPPSLKKSYKPK